MPRYLGLVGGWRYGTPVPSPISVHKFAGVTQQFIGMGTKVITLSLQWQNTKDRTFRESVEVDNKEIIISITGDKKKKKRNYVFNRQPWRHNNVNRDLKIRLRRRQRERHKQQFHTCITLFCTFLCRYCTTTTWKCLISRCTEGRTEEVHKRRRNFLSLSELEYGSLEFNFGRVRLPLTKLVTWSNRDEDWKNANSLFQRRFLCRRRPRILRSIISPQRRTE